MRMSCNGCRVLRKGCSDNCSIRPCLQWLKNPDHQANATVFLAKFYGRAGLLNLLSSGPDHLRPAVFRSLLYEACGRIVNPVYGSVGLLWSGNWQLCQSAVDAVLRGAPIDSAVDAAFDIRHVPKGGGVRTAANRGRFKRSVAPTESIDLENLQLMAEVTNGCHEVSNDDSSAATVSNDGAVELDLTLGFEPACRTVESENPNETDARVDLGLDLVS